MNEVLTGETACSCRQSGESWRCSKTSPKCTSSLGCRQQSPASVHNASWTFILKTASLAASLEQAEPHSVQLSSAAGLDTKQQNPDYREMGLGGWGGTGSFDVTNNANLARKIVVRLFSTLASLVYFAVMEGHRSCRENW